jgi:hypothetical protein
MRSSGAMKIFSVSGNIMIALNADEAEMVFAALADGDPDWK